MSQPPIAVVHTEETVFFSHVDGTLRQWIKVTIDNRAEKPVTARVAIHAHKHNALTVLHLRPGVWDYTCYAPVLWPDNPATDDATLSVSIGTSTTITHLSVGHHRPWRVYLLSDVCTDYTWVYHVEESCRSDDASLTEAEIAMIEGTRGAPESIRNHYNLAHARQVEFFLQRFPERADKLFQCMREGSITLNPFFNMALTCDMSLEELIRQFYPARAWARRYGLDLGYANHQETPSIAWIMPSLLAGCGISHLVKSILPYECPWVKRLEEPPVFVWGGPDGSRVLVRRRNVDYVEGQFVLRDLRATNTSLHDEVIPSYEQLGDIYPFNAIALVGCYGDLSPTSRELPAKKVATIAAYNAQGWEYPRLINASHKQFWDDIDAQIEQRRLQLPTFRGDYGAAWDAWPATLARDFAGWRRAQEHAGTADKLAAILSRLDVDWYESYRYYLAKGWQYLIYLADHAWNGANDGNRALNASLRHEWQVTANHLFDTVIETGLRALGRHVPTGEDNRVLVFNGLGWPRTGVVSVSGIDGDVSVVDLATGKRVPSQILEEDQHRTLVFEAADVPSVGYRVFALEACNHLVRSEGLPWQFEGYRFEGPFYSLEVSPVTGGIVSLYDKRRGRELVDQQSSYHLNQCIYCSEGTEYTPRLARVEMGACGPVLAQLVIRSLLKNIAVSATITLYAHLDRLDIRNVVEKVPSSERQELNFVFPFQVPDREFRFEAPGAIVIPGAEQRPGAGQAVTAVRHFVDVSNKDFGVTLSQADSGLVEFGHRTSTEDPLEPDASNSTVLALALHNSIDWHEATRDQGGVTQFTFRYALRGHSGSFNPVSALRFGWEDNNEMMAVPLPHGQAGSLPECVHSFISIEPENAVLTCLKVGEEGGLLVRLWECAGCDTPATITTRGLGAPLHAVVTDLLERDRESLPMNGDLVTIPLQKRGLAAIRLTGGQD